MATLTTQTMTPVGGTALTTASAAGGGDAVNRPGKGMYLNVRNGDASPITVTIAVPGNLWNGQAAPDTEVTVAATSEKMIPIDARYANSSNQAVVTYSAVTSVTVAALQF